VVRKSEVFIKYEAEVSSRVSGGERGVVDWLAGHHDECGARAYNGGLGAEPPARSRGTAPDQGLGGEAPLKLKAFWSLDVQRSRQI